MTSKYASETAQVDVGNRTAHPTYLAFLPVVVPLLEPDTDLLQALPHQILIVFKGRRMKRQ